MKLGHIKRLCNTYIKKGCVGCPGSYKGRCMFGPRPPMDWRNKEITNFILKMQEGKENGSNSKSRI